MLHVNRRDGFTIAVSEAKYIAPIAKRTVLSDDALGVLVPILEDIAKWDSIRIRSQFEEYGLQIHEWHKVQTDFLTIREDVAGDRFHGGFQGGASCLIGSLAWPWGFPRVPTYTGGRRLCGKLTLQARSWLFAQRHRR